MKVFYWQLRSVRWHKTSHIHTQNHRPWLFALDYILTMVGLGVKVDVYWTKQISCEHGARFTWLEGRILTATIKAPRDFTKIRRTYRLAFPQIKDWGDREYQDLAEYLTLYGSLIIQGLIIKDLNKSVPTISEFFGKRQLNTSPIAPLPGSNCDKTDPVTIDSDLETLLGNLQTLKLPAQKKLIQDGWRQRMGKMIDPTGWTPKNLVFGATTAEGKKRAEQIIRYCKSRHLLHSAYYGQIEFVRAAGISYPGRISPECVALINCLQTGKTAGSDMSDPSLVIAAVKELLANHMVAKASNSSANCCIKAGEFVMHLGGFPFAGKLIQIPRIELASPSLAESLSQCIPAFADLVKAQTARAEQIAGLKSQIVAHQQEIRKLDETILALKAQSESYQSLSGISGIF